MTPEEYDTLSNDLAAKNAELLVALDGGDLDVINGVRSQFADLRRQVDAAWRSVNGLDAAPVLADPMLGGV